MQIGGSARGYQALFVPLAALSSPGYSPMEGQPAVYLCIATFGANVRFLWGARTRPLVLTLAFMRPARIR
jgi:hypothetical protein